MVSAAELQALHATAAAKSATQPGAQPQPLMADPFPPPGGGGGGAGVMTDDPFPPSALAQPPPPPDAASPSSSSYASAQANGSGGGGRPAAQHQKPSSARGGGATTTNAQPDFSSQSAFPSLGAAAAAASASNGKGKSTAGGGGGQWGKKPATASWGPSGGGGTGGAPSSSSTSSAPANGRGAPSAVAPVIQRQVAQETFVLPTPQPALGLASESAGALGGGGGGAGGGGGSATAGGGGGVLAKALAKVQAKHRHVKVEASSNRKAGTTTFVVKGPDAAAVKAARRDVYAALAKPVSLTTMIPASLRAFVIGAKGKNINQIKEATGCRINIPRANESAEENADAGAASAASNNNGGADVDWDSEPQVAVVVEGDEVSARQAVSQLQSLVAQRTSKVTLRLSHLEPWLYPFLAGARNANAARLENDVGEGQVSVRVPPRAVLLQHQQQQQQQQKAGQPAQAKAELAAAAGASSRDQRERDLSIVVSGEREPANKVAAALESHAQELRRTLRTLNISIPKRQHRFLVGDAAQDILASTSCFVELAPQDDASDTVTIRGPQSQLPQALTAAMEKANAVKVESVDVVSAHRAAAAALSPSDADAAALEHAKLLLRWLNVSGKLPKTAGDAAAGASSDVGGVQVYLPRPALVQSTGQAHLEVVGRDADAVAKARAEFESYIRSVPPSFVRRIEIDPLLHRFIIGKKGAGLSQYTAKGVDVLFPPAASSAVGESQVAGHAEARSDVALLLTGAHVAAPLLAAKERKARDAEAARVLDEVEAMVRKAAGDAADLRTEVVRVAAKHHRAIVGPNGTTLNAIIGEERLVSVRVGSGRGGGGDDAADDDAITVRGPSAEVERVATELRKVAKAAEEDAIVNGHVETLLVEPSHVPHLVGRGGSAVGKLRDELGVRVDIDDATAAATSSSAATASTSKKGTAAAGRQQQGTGGGKSKVTLTGRKENVLEARRRILAQTAQLADETSVTIKVPPSMHGSIIGQGGKYVTRLQDTYGVRINFPSQGGGKAEQKEDEVVIRGGKKGVDGAKAEIAELLEFERENNNVVTVPVSTKSIARIMGRGGSNVNRIREETGVQVDVDREETSADGKATIRLRGTKDGVASAKAEILAVAAEVDSEQVYELTIPAEYHARLIGPGGQNLRELVAKAGGDDASRSAAQLVRFPRRGEASGGGADKVVVRGPAALAKRVRDELAAAAKALSDRVTVGVSVSPSSHRPLLARIRELQAAHSVRIHLPQSREYASAGECTNAEELARGGVGSESVVKVTGLPEACEAAAKEIAEAFTSVTTQLRLPRGVAARLATPALFRSLRNELGVNVDVPRSPAVGGGSTAARKPAEAAAASASSARIDANDADDAGGEGWELRELDAAELAAEAEEVSWTLSGKDEASLAKATRRIESEREASPSTAATATHEGRLQVARAAVPRVVGKGGATLRELEARSGARIEVPRDLAGVCVVRGTRDAVLAARDAIEDLVARAL